MSIEDADRTADLFRRLRDTGDPRARAELCESHDSLVRFLATKFANRGEALEDLIQVGRVALVMAVDRFDPERGLKFSTFATPTIVGEIKRHFRDRAWSIHVPRSLQELNQKVLAANQSLAQTFGRSPTVSEIAENLGATEEEVLRAIELGRALETVSLDAPVTSEAEGALTVADAVGQEDPDISELVGNADLLYALGQVDPRERAILKLRFVDELSQLEVARRLGISQMHVSRLQARALRQLRRVLNEARR